MASSSGLCPSPQFCVCQEAFAQVLDLLRIPTLYSPNLALCNIFIPLMFMVKPELKGTRFDTVDTVKVKAAEMMTRSLEDVPNSYGAI
ncbi:hypothetical protein AVEN_223506-1 [Araneus ventricosus]|uniref:Uncharacterized protein n=1 Tax=Araneus ventricosus TaxID=182803 RepID=A0A4Y2DKQ9_ARAVE|nr:hypothetical protein AVEN_223506-1 [Araneus ventricosus]